jgi:amino acid transporter
MPERRTPWFAIAFTTAIAAVLVATGDLDDLADTTVALLVCVFAIVNVCVLVLRRDPVDHDHFTVPSAVPVGGIVISITLLTQVEAGTYLRAAILLSIGALLWVLNWLFVRPHAPDPPVRGAGTTA